MNQEGGRLLVDDEASDAGQHRTHHRGAHLHVQAEAINSLPAHYLIAARLRISTSVTLAPRLHVYDERRDAVRQPCLLASAGRRGGQLGRVRKGAVAAPDLLSRGRSGGERMRGLPGAGAVLLSLQTESS